MVTNPPQSFSDIICIIDRSLNIKSGNCDFYSILNMNTDNLESKKALDLLHPDDSSQLVESLASLNSQNLKSEFKARVSLSEKEELLISWSLSTDIQMETFYLVGRVIEKSYLKLTSLQQIYDVLMDYSIVAVTNNAGEIIEANNKFCEISGYRREELIGQNHRILKSGLHSDEFYKNLWSTISSGKTWTGLIKNKKKNGKIYYVYSIITPIFNNKGKIENYLAVRYDMTNLIKAKNELARMSGILNNTSSIAKVGGWELVVETGELNWTDETFKILEVEQKQGQKPMLPEGISLYIPEHQPIIEKAVEEAIEFGTPFSLELKALTAKGNEIWVFANGIANYKDGKVKTLSGTIQNIHERKIIEQELEDERLKSLQNAKLASLGELAAGIAHEINNPLSVILASTQIMGKLEKGSDKFNDRIETINRSCERISKITNNLVKFSRQSHGDELKNTKVLKIIEECVLLASLKAKDNFTKLDFDSNTDASIYCNEVQIEQVLINLLNNAVDAVCELEEKWVKVETFENSEQVFVRIKDSGSGIPKDIQEKLFEPFYSTKEIGKGTGLGLSVSKGILDEHNATIEVDDKQENTCFILTFPKVIELT